MGFFESETEPYDVEANKEHWLLYHRS
jgi:hypothetical protein